MLLSYVLEAKVEGFPGVHLDKQAYGSEVELHNTLWIFVVVVSFRKANSYIPRERSTEWMVLVVSQLCRSSGYVRKLSASSSIFIN
jgi:hypothetical protein